jgi:hypothetical protein
VFALVVLYGTPSPVSALGQSPQARDSAGITVVSIAQGDGPSGSWTITEKPSLVLGQISGEEPYLFGNVRDALRTPDGGIVVVDKMAFEIRVFDSAGRHQVTFGRPGGGPEEFGGAPWIALSPPDTLVVWDPGHHRLSRFDLSGVLLGQSTIMSDLDALGIRPFPDGQVWQTTADGAVLWTRSTRSTLPLFMRTEGLRQNTARFVLVETDGVHEFGPQPLGQTYWVRRAAGGRSGLARPFAPRTAIALGRERVAVSDPERWEVRIFDRVGQLQAIWRGDFPRVAVTRSMLRTERERASDAAAGLRVTRRQLETAFDGLQMADSVPAIAHLFWDQVGNLWVARRAWSFRDISGYDVIGEGGQWRAWVELPEHVERVFEVGADYVLAGVRDGFDVEYVQLLELEKGVGR